MPSRGPDNGRAIFQKAAFVVSSLFCVSPYITIHPPPLLLHFILPIYYEMPRRELALLELLVIIIYIIIRRKNLGGGRGEGHIFWKRKEPKF